MPNRVYMNRRTGEECIHVEITYGEIQELLTRPAGEPTRQLWQLLATAHRQFNELTPAPELTDIDREHAADEHETAAEHARGKHEHCGPTCETEFPGSALRNFILAKGYPGTAGTLDELLRRASASPVRHQLTELEHHAAWHAIEGAAGEEGADPGTVLAAVLATLGIDPPQQPTA